MALVKCPGQDTRFWTPDDVFEIQCGACGTPVEFFKDDAKRRCPTCGHIVWNPKLQLGCAQWCKHAKECLGFDPKEVQANSGANEALADQILAAVKREFGDDQRRISHAIRVLEYAEEIMRKEGGNPRVVIAAALLHDIGIHEAERKYGSAAGKYQEIEGPPIAERILKELGVDHVTIDHVCRIVANHHSARNIDTMEFRIIWDADWLVNLPDEHPDLSGEKLKELIDGVFKTETGKKKAYALFIQQDTEE